MAIPDYLLDKSWSIQYVPSGGPTPLLHELFRATQSPERLSAQLHTLSTQCRDYILSRAPAYTDDLNDETEKTGVLRECIIDYVKEHNGYSILGLSVETRYQKTTYRVVLVPCHPLDNRKCSVSFLLVKGSQKHVENVKGWLEVELGVPRAESFVFPVGSISRMCSEFVMKSNAAYWATGDEAEALRQATLRQVVGSLRITISISNAAGTGVAPQLKSVDFEVPVDTVGLLIKKVRGRDGGGGAQFLEELAGALHERTGLRLPLAGEGSEAGANTGGEGATNGNAEPEIEPPLKVTRIHCASFALRADGGFKLAGKPIADAEGIGYDEHYVRVSYLGLFQSIFREAARRRQQEE